jgi:polyribonucleotide nucleotidyltransferase
MRLLVLDEGLRADGRGVADIRPISSRAGLLPRTHGSSLFTRGETQVRRAPRAGNRLSLFLFVSHLAPDSPTWPLTSPPGP